MSDIASFVFTFVIYSCMDYMIMYSNFASTDLEQ